MEDLLGSWVLGLIDAVSKTSPCLRAVKRLEGKGSRGTLTVSAVTY